MVFRKLKVGTIKRRYCVLVVVSALLFLVYTFGSRINCWDLVIEYRISKECSRYFNNEITGSYCPELCAGTSVTGFGCLPSQDSKWIGNKSGKTIVLNRARTAESYDTLSWIDHQGELNYPTATEFTNLVRRLILFNFNRTLPQEQLNALVQLKNEHNQVLFHASQAAAWNLIQDNDFLIASLFEDKELFPRIYGSCGTIFFSEYLGQPVRVERGAELSLGGWKMNIKMAVLIMDFIEELEQSNLVMCDIDTNHFGIVDNRMKYGDMTIIFSTIFINRILRSGKTCTTDDDCSYKGCKSVCNRQARVCAENQINSNLQLVCEKVFQGTPSQPGILYWNRTPKALKHLIDRCANPQMTRDVNPHKRLAPSSELRNLIYNELANIYETLGEFLNRSVTSQLKIIKLLIPLIPKVCSLWSKGKTKIIVKSSSKSDIIVSHRPVLRNIFIID